jgi:hypothetical protein
MTWNTEHFITTTFSFVFLITTIISYVYSEYPYIKIPLTISVLLTLGFNIASLLLHLKGAWKADSGSTERKTHIGFGITQFILTVVIILIVKTLN